MRMQCTMATVTVGDGGFLFVVVVVLVKRDATCSNCVFGIITDMRGYKEVQHGVFNYEL